jgi:hypothetical protein
MPDPDESRDLERLRAEHADRMRFVQGPHPSKVPDLIQPVVGYRGFNLEDGALASTNGTFVHRWRPGTNKAECHIRRAAAGGYRGPRHPPGSRAPAPHPSPSPQEQCACGLYGMHNVRVVAQLTGELTAAIVAWGRIIVHPNGFRAEYARVVALAPEAEMMLVEPEARSEVRAVADAYGVPMVPVWDLEPAAREHGIPVPEDLRPEEEELPEAGGVGGSGAAGLWQVAPATMLPAAARRSLASFGPGGPPAHLHFAAASGSLAIAPTPRQWVGPNPWRRWGTNGVLWLFVAAANTAFATGLYGGGVWNALGAMLAAAIAVYNLKRWIGPRLRCFDRASRGGPDHDHHARWKSPSERGGLTRGDRCPECGWKLH